MARIVHFAIIMHDDVPQAREPSPIVMSCRREDRSRRGLSTSSRGAARHPACRKAALCRARQWAYRIDLSRRIAVLRYGLRMARSSMMSTGRPNSETSSSRRSTRSSVLHGASGSKVTRRSTSLSGVAVPRAIERKTDSSAIRQRRHIRARVSADGKLIASMPPALSHKTSPNSWEIEGRGGSGPGGKDRLRAHHAFDSRNRPLARSARKRAEFAQLKGATP